MAALAQPRTDLFEAYYHREELSRLQRIYGRVFGFPLAATWLRFRHILALLPECPARVMDIGCGNGYLLFYLASRNPETRIDAIDLDADVIAHNLEVASRLGLDNIRAEAGDWEPLTRDRRGRYDTVVLLDVVTEIDEQVALLQRVRELLRPGGRLLLGSAMPSPMRRVVDAVDPYWQDQEQLARVRSLDLFGVLREAGFEVETQRWLAGLPFGVPAHCLDVLFYKSRGLKQLLHAALFPLAKATMALELLVPPLWPTGIVVRARAVE